MVEKPKAKLKGDSVEIFLGYAKSPIWWVDPRFEIVDTDIHLSAQWSLRELPNTVTVKLPDPKKIYHMFWIDSDGKRHEIPIIIADKEIGSSKKH